MDASGARALDDRRALVRCGRVRTSQNCGVSLVNPSTKPIKPKSVTRPTVAAVENLHGIPEGYLESSSRPRGRAPSSARWWSSSGGSTCSAW